MESRAEGVRTAIVTDSASDLPPALASELGIAIVPLDVRLGPVGPEELRRLDGASFWQRCASSPDLPATSAPSPGAFGDAFLAAAEQGAQGVVCITLSSALSATYQSALAGAEEVKGTIAVEVIDSRFATMGEGLLAIVAAASAGGEPAACADTVREAIGRTEVFGTLDSLESLRRGGRIGAAQSLLGSLLSIKPVIEVRDGVVEPESRQRTRSRSLAYLVDKLAAARPIERLAVVHAAADDLDEFLAMVAKVYSREETIVSYIGPVIGSHTGKGTIGICLQRQRPNG